VHRIAEHGSATQRMAKQSNPGRVLATGLFPKCFHFTRMAVHCRAQQRRAVQSNSDRAYANEPLPSLFGSRASHRMAWQCTAEQRRAEHIGLPIGNGGFSEVFSLHAHRNATHRIAVQCSAEQLG